MIWIKTDAGRVEMQARTVLKDRGLRTLLLLIDGQKSEDMLCAHLMGTKPADFRSLQSLGLIEPVGGAAPRSAAPAPSAAKAPASAPTSAPVTAPAAATPAPLDYAQFTAELTKIISRELGLRGFVLTLAVEKAGTIAELQAVAQRTLEQVRDRKGESAAASARRALYGG